MNNAAIAHDTPDVSDVPLCPKHGTPMRLMYVHHISGGFTCNYWYCGLPYEPVTGSSTRHCECTSVARTEEEATRLPEGTRAPKRTSPGKDEESMLMPNDTKIRFCNAMIALLTHMIQCKACDAYIHVGTGDLCSDGKVIIAKELHYMDTTPVNPHQHE